LYRRELAARIEQGSLDRKQQAEHRAQRKRALTADTSSRWAGAITRTVEDQYRLGLRALGAHVRSLDSAIETLQARCALAPNDRDAKITGYRDAAERFTKTRRLAGLRDRAEQARHAFTEARPVVVVGGKRLPGPRSFRRAAGDRTPAARARPLRFLPLKPRRSGRLLVPESIGKQWIPAKNTPG